LEAIFALSLALMPCLNALLRLAKANNLLHLFAPTKGIEECRLVGKTNVAPPWINSEEKERKMTLMLPPE
jgi:hypothetical protein